MMADDDAQIIVQKSMKKKPIGLALQLLGEYDLDDRRLLDDEPYE